jgi:hypothetical protein
MRQHMKSDGTVRGTVRGQRAHKPRARRALAVAGAAALALNAAPSLMGATKALNTAATSAGGNFNWSTSTIWSPSNQPLTGDTVNLLATDAIARNIVFDNAATATSLLALTLDNTGGGSTTFQMPDGSPKTLSVASVLVGNSGVGVIAQDGGTLNVNGAGGSDQLMLGSLSTAVGSWIMNGGALNVTATNGMTVGKASGQSLFDQFEGTVTIGTPAANRNLFIGTDLGSIGNYTVEAVGCVTTVNGNVYVGGSAFGSGGSGTFLVAGGIANITGTLKVWLTSGTSVELHTGATLNVSALDFSGDAARFSWSGGTLNLTASGVTLDGTGPLGASLFLPEGKNLGLGGALTLSASSDVVLDGGTLSASSIIGTGSFTFNSGSITLTASGLTIDAAGPVGSTVSLPTGSALTVSGPLTNNGSAHLSAGTMGGASALSNVGVIDGFGTIVGAGGISNSGMIAVSGGNITIAKTGTFNNLAGGVIQLEAGRQFQINGGNLINNGTIDLDGGGSITSTGAFGLTNNSDGLIIGAGTISVPLSNAGSIAVTAGTLNITGALTNNGSIALGGISSKVMIGGAGLTNGVNGSVEGVGRVSAPLNNLGRVEAVGGTLTLAGATTNAASGTLAAGAGTTLLTLGTLNANQGMISLTGGTLDTNHQVLTNAAGGIVSGRGTIRASAIVNNGQFLLAGGNTDVYSPVTGNSGSKFILSGGGNGYFYSPVNMNAGSEFRVGTNSVAAFFGAVNGSSFFTGTGLKDFEAGSSNLQALISQGSTEVQNGATINVTVVRENSLTVGGTVNIAPNGGPAGTSNLGTLTVIDAGKIDLKDNDLVVRSGTVGSFVGGSYKGLSGLIASGRNGGSWNGPGIVSSTIIDSTTSIGIATAEQVGVVNSSWSGQPIESGNVLIMYTYGGDANLDGKITISDYGKIDFNVAIPGASGWANGDFNYDGKINISDYGIIDFNIGIQGPPLLSGAGSSSLSGVSAVPEPAGASLLLLGAGALIGGNRRRRKA